MEKLLPPASMARLRVLRENGCITLPDGKKKESLEYNQAGKRNGIRILWDSLGKKITEETWLNDPKTVKTKTFHPNGKVNEIFLYQGNYLQGIFQKFSENRKLAISGIYKNSKKNGLWEYYDEDGNLLKVETWRMDKLSSTKNMKGKAKRK